MNGPYVSDNGDVWIERFDVPWPRAQAEARSYLSEMGWEDEPMDFVGVEQEVRVSDEHEYVHGDDDGCADSQDTTIEAPGFVACCRTIAAYHFRGRER